MKETKRKGNRREEPAKRMGREMVRRPTIPHRDTETGQATPLRPTKKAGLSVSFL
ncbi:MAG: hypothetical protein ACTTHE_00315 [Prevotella multiformis]|uniref:hypothetical protein n=1 Tax=Prevotella multiformis TaxID=282402 RepID=UPI003F9FE8B5